LISFVSVEILFVEEISGFFTPAADETLILEFGVFLSSLSSLSGLSGLPKCFRVDAFFGPVILLCFF